MPYRYDDSTQQETRQEQPTDVEEFRAKALKVERTELVAPSYVGWNGRPRTYYGGGDIYDYIESRRLSVTPTPRLCIQRLKLDVQNTAWEIVPLIEEGKSEPTAEAVEHARQIFNWLYFRPNYNYESFSTIMAKFTEDILVHDAGVIHKMYGSNGDKRLLEIHARDGALFNKDIDTYNRLGVIYHNVQVNRKNRENMRVGYWYNWSATPKVAFEPHEIVYISHDPRTDIDYGTSKIQVLKSMIMSCMYSEEYYHKYWEEGGNNPCIISPDITTSGGTSNILTEGEYKRFRDAFKDKLTDYMKNLVSPSKTQINPLSDPKAIGWLESEDSYRHLIVALFNETPAILGWTKDIHKATDESQKSIYIQKGLWPLLNTIQWYMNTQVIADWFWDEDNERNIFSHGHKGLFAGNKMDVMFRFKLFDPIGEKMQLEIDEMKLKNGLDTINNVLRSQHKPTVAWGDINPMFLLGVQQWSQGYGSGGMDASIFKLLTGGVEPGIKQIQQAVTPKPANENEDIDKEVVKSYEQSRIAVAFGAGNIAPFEISKTIRTSPRLVRNDYPSDKVKQ
ncbi:MAG: phage portal protein [Candidatus Babeliales bacterium]|jgi:hypothetical protein